MHIPPKPQTPTARDNKTQILPILRFALIHRTKSPKLTEVIPVSRPERPNGVMVCESRFTLRPPPDFRIPSPQWSLISCKQTNRVTSKSLVPMVTAQVSSTIAREVWCAYCFQQSDRVAMSNPLCIALEGARLSQGLCRPAFASGLRASASQ